MIWFFLPVCLVITNDIFAYLCGITFGRTQLIKVSPKKTVEGFVGAWACTLVIGSIIVNLLMRFEYMICPVTDLSANAFSGMTCIPNLVFTPHVYPIPPPFEKLSKSGTFTIAPVQFHIIAMATFASLIAPFGGFFASGLKRTFKLKDFGDTIPGHGGVTDRMDCQFVMGFFSYMYYQSFIAQSRAMSVGAVLEIAINSLSHQQQLELVRSLVKYLYNKGMLDANSASTISSLEFSGAGRSSH
jgi:phosphatidate cytidylyltransferase